MCVVLYIDDKVTVFTGFRAGEKQRARKKREMDAKFASPCVIVGFAAEPASRLANYTDLLSFDAENYAFIQMLLSG